MHYLHLDEIEEKELVSGFKVRFVHSENMTRSRRRRYYSAACRSFRKVRDPKPSH